MSRLPFLNPNELKGKIGEVIAALPAKLNIFRIMAHASDTAIAQIRLGRAILGKQKLGHRERELLILLAMHLEKGRYEWLQHVSIAEGVGVSQEQIRAIQALDLTSGVFTAADRAALAFGKQLVENVRVETHLFAEMRRHFSPQEIVEAILAIGYYMTLARLTEATETEFDTDAGMVIFGSAQSKARS